MKFTATRCLTAALLHEPSDSSLLWDRVRVMVRLLQRADAFTCTRAWRDQRRAAKGRVRAIKYVRGRPKWVQHYRALLKITQASLAICNRRRNN